MATSTTNLGLIKPAGTDKIRIAQINSNMDVIDAKMGAVGNTPLQTQINNNLQITQHIIPASTGDTLTSVSALNSALSNNSHNRIAISASARASLADAGMIPVASSGLWEVIKSTSGYMFMEYSTYRGAKYIANINNSVLSEWIETTNLNIENGIAIVAVGNTHSAITTGQFVYVRNHDTLSAGIYTAKSNIAANATLSTSNLTAVPNGGLNALASRSIKVKTVTVTIPANGTSVSAAANPDSGFSFMCWLSAVPIRWAGLIWLSSYVSASVNVYTDTSATSEREVRLAFIEKNY